MRNWGGKRRRSEMKRIRVPKKIGAGPCNLATQNNEQGLIFLYHSCTREMLKATLVRGCSHTQQDLIAGPKEMESYASLWHCIKLCQFFGSDCHGSTMDSCANWHIERNRARLLLLSYAVKQRRSCLSTMRTWLIFCCHVACTEHAGYHGATTAYEHVCLLLLGNHYQKKGKLHGRGNPPYIN
eukprot:1139797-Pelagomonas_calceolata.AAC.1